MSEWQPIETSPKDGTSVLLFFPDFQRQKIWLGHFIDRETLEYGKSASKCQYWYINQSFSFGLDHPVPTHWMPLPAAPDSFAK